MLKEAAGISKIYIACGFTDLRMGIDGLTDLIRERFSLDPLEKGTLFLFCGRKSDRIRMWLLGSLKNWMTCFKEASLISPSLLSIFQMILIKSIIIQMLLIY